MAETPHVDQPLVRAEESNSENGSTRYIIENPWFRFLDSINFSKQGAVLPIANGGTGQSSGTGTGLPVFQTAPHITGPFLTTPNIIGQIGYQPISPTNPLAQVSNGDARQVSVTAVATTIMDQDLACLFVVHDITSGGMSVGLMDATGGVVVVVAGIAGIAFTRLAGTGLQAAVTAGANPRILSPYTIGIG